MSNAHLEGYQPGGVINVNGGEKFREIIAPLREAQRPWCRFGVTWRLEKILRCPLANYITILLGRRPT